MNIQFFSIVFRTLILAAMLPQMAEAQDPRVQVITHNLAGAFCKIGAFDSSKFEEIDQVKKAVELLSSYKTLIKSDTSEKPHVILFHFQEVCEAKKSVLLFRLGTHQDNAHKIIQSALEIVMAEWKCLNSVAFLNFATFYCYDPVKVEATDIELPAPIVKLVGEFNEEFWAKTLKTTQAKFEECAKDPNKCALKTYINEKGGDADKLQSDLKKHLNVFSTRFLTKGSIISPIVLRIRPDETQSQQQKQMIWIVSANVHFSSKKLNHRTKQFEDAYKTMILMEKYLNNKASKISFTQHLFFNFISGDFNSRAYREKNDKLTFPLNSFDKSNINSLGVSQFKSDPENQNFQNVEDFYKELAMCLLVQIKIGQSNYGADKLDSMIKPESSTLQSKLYSKCSLLYKAYLENIEEYRTELVERMNRKVWDSMEIKDPIQIMREPALDGINVPTFVYTVYTHYNNPEIDFLEPMIEMISENNKANLPKKPFMNLFSVVPAKYGSNNPIMFKSFDTYKGVVLSQQPNSPQSITGNDRSNVYKVVENEIFKDKKKIDDDLFSEEIKAKLDEKFPKEELKKNEKISTDPVLSNLWKLLDYATQLKPGVHETPAWCDRVMYLQSESPETGVTKIEYKADHSIRFSDHVPVTFTGSLKYLKKPLKLTISPWDIDQIEKAGKTKTLNVSDDELTGNFYDMIYDKKSSSELNDFNGVNQNDSESNFDDSEEDDSIIGLEGISLEDVDMEESSTSKKLVSSSNAQSQSIVEVQITVDDLVQLEKVVKSSLRKRLI